MLLDDVNVKSLWQVVGALPDEVYKYAVCRGDYTEHSVLTNWPVNKLKPTSQWQTDQLGVKHV